MHSLDHFIIVDSPTPDNYEALSDPLVRVPAEVALHILSFFTDSELGLAAAVCRDWYGLANDDLVWRERYRRRFDLEENKKKKPWEHGTKPDDEVIETEKLVLDDPRLNDMLQTSAQEVDLESGPANEPVKDEGEGHVHDDEEETEELEGIKRLVIPSTLSKSAKWKTLYVEKHMEPQIRLLRILTENTSLGRLMDKRRLKKIETTILNPNRLILDRLGKYPHLMSAFAAKRSLVQTKLEFLQHITNNLVFCLLGLIVWCCVEFFLPDFFDYPYLYIPFTWSNLGRFWPLFGYAAFLCVAYNWLWAGSHPPPKALRRKIFLWSAVNSILAGLLEECGFRFLYICTAMLSILIIDLVINAFMLLITSVLCYAAIASVVAIVRLNQLTARGALTILGVFAVGSLSAYLSSVSLVMWVYETIVLPGTDVITFGQFEDIFSDEGRRLFVVGMLVANSWFRDAHKYSGLLGWANSWVIGFVMMYACVHYGLMLTIALHALYDLEFVVLSFVLFSARTRLGWLPSEPLLPIVVS